VPKSKYVVVFLNYDMHKKRTRANSVFACPEVLAKPTLQSKKERPRLPQAFLLFTFPVVLKKLQDF
jgi:hypothetical protein